MALDKYMAWWVCVNTGCPMIHKIDDHCNKKTNGLGAPLVVWHIPMYVDVGYPPSVVDRTLKRYFLCSCHRCQPVLTTVTIMNHHPSLLPLPTTWAPQRFAGRVMWQANYVSNLELVDNVFHRLWEFTPPTSWWGKKLHFLLNFSHQATWWSMNITAWDYSRGSWLLFQSWKKSSNHLAFYHVDYISRCIWSAVSIRLYVLPVSIVTSAGQRGRQCGSVPLPQGADCSIAPEFPLLHDPCDA